MFPFPLLPEDSPGSQEPPKWWDNEEYEEEE